MLGKPGVAGIFFGAYGFPVAFYFQKLVVGVKITDTPGALISVIGHEEIRHLIEYNSFSLSSILEKLNVKINDTLNSDNAFGSDGMDL
ncbi:MAG: hypothetical protein O9353_12415, partial [Bacteroidia bacterium]|nr:hypothetical protein [Bacteroidia bacterium]